MGRTGGGRRKEFVDKAERDVELKRRANDDTTSAIDGAGLTH